MKMIADAQGFWDQVGLQDRVMKEDLKNEKRCFHL